MRDKMALEAELETGAVGEEQGGAVKEEHEVTGAILSL